MAQARMWKTKQVCSICKTRLLMTRLECKYFCPECWVYRKVSKKDRLADSLEVRLRK